MNKPTITFYEPFEIIVKQDGQIISYLDDSKMTESELLEKYSIDYNSFIENGLPKHFEPNCDIHAILLDYINMIQKID